MTAPFPFAIALLFFLATVSTTSYAAGEKQPISLQIPEAVLAETLAAIVPIQLDRPKEMVEGALTIDKISNLQLAEQTLSAQISVSGKDIQLNTDIAGHQLRVNVGSAAMQCALYATIRFEAASQTLFVKPQIADLQSSGNGNAGAAGALLAGLFTGREFPIAIDRLQPIVTNAGDKQINITLKLVDVKITNRAITMAFFPELGVKAQNSK